MLCVLFKITDKTVCRPFYNATLNETLYTGRLYIYIYIYIYIDIYIERERERL